MEEVAKLQDAALLTGAKSAKLVCLTHVLATAEADKQVEFMSLLSALRNPDV